MADLADLLAPPRPPDLQPGPAPRISVLVPAFQAAGTIGEALESALAQSPPAYEVVVSDDGSTDDLPDALAPFAGHVRVVRGPNAGLAVARNRAAAAARGDLLALLDADDVWLPGRVAALGVAATVRPDLDIITTDAVLVRDGLAEPAAYYDTRRFWLQHQDLGILHENFVFGAGAVRTAAFRAVGGYRPGLRYAEDWDLWLRMLLSGSRAGMVRRPLYEYRRHAASLTGQRLELALGVLQVLRGARPLLRTPQQRARLTRTEQRWRETAARTAWRSGDSRCRWLAARAALGAGATPAARARYGAVAVLPRVRSR